MSWQAYVDEHLMCQLAHGGQLKSAAILGHDGSPWAQSESFPVLTTEQINNIMEGFDDANSLAAKGLWVGSWKFMVVQGDPGSVIRGRCKKDEEKNIDAMNICIKKTTSALVVGISVEPVPASDNNVVVENLGDYLLGQGY